MSSSQNPLEKLDNALEAGKWDDIKDALKYFEAVDATGIQTSAQTDSKEDSPIKNIVETWIWPINPLQELPTTYNGHKPLTVPPEVPLDFGMSTNTPVLATNRGKVFDFNYNLDPKKWVELDLDADTPIREGKDKTVSYNNTGKFYAHGNHVILQHYKDGKEYCKTAYCHLRSISVELKRGIWIEQGHVIGLSGGDKPTRVPKLKGYPWHYKITNFRGGYGYFKNFGPDGSSPGAHLHYEGPHP